MSNPKRVANAAASVRQRHRPPRRDVPAHDGLRPVIDQRARHPTEMGERPPVAGEERGLVHRGGETAERVPRVGQHQMEGVHRPAVTEQVPLLTPIHLPLRAGRHLEPAVQPAQRVLIPAPELSSDPRPRLRQEHLHPLIGPGEAVLGDQPLMDHAALQHHVRPQPGLHHRHQRINQPRLGALPRRRRQRPTRRVDRQVLLHRLPVMPGLPGDLRHAHSRVPQDTEPSNVHPLLRIEDHANRSPFGLIRLAADKTARVITTRADMNPTHRALRTSSRTPFAT